MADTLELSGGIGVDGKIVRQTDAGGRSAVIIEVDPELRIAIPQQRILRSTSEQDEILVWYRQKAEAAGDDADAHYELARTCAANNLLAQRDFHYKRAIEIDPDHSKARSAMDYVRDGSGWILFDQQQSNRGLIHAPGGWQVPEVYLREKRREEYDVAAKIWKQEFARLRTAALRPGKRQEEALEALKAVDDPIAATAFAEALENFGGKVVDPPAMRMLYLKKLAEFKTTLGVQVLVKRSLFDNDSNIRRVALEELQEYGASSAVASYLQILNNTDHKPGEVTAALRALQSFPDWELWPVYVDALITEHKFVKQPGPGMSVGTNSLGGSGMSTGGKAEVVISPQQNSGALQPLREIAPDVDYRYDENAWRRYFAEQLIGSPRDLRRDP